jgi:hypothetical protein
MKKPGADLIAHYLDPDRLPVQDRWSRKHAHTQGRLCERFAAPVIATITCQDIKAVHMQMIVNAAPTAGEGERVRRMVSALVTAGVDAGYLVNSRLARVHWQVGDRPLPAPVVSIAGEAALWVDPAEIPSDDDVAMLGKALAAARHGDRDELMANTAAYSGLRWGELAALTIPQVSQAARVITVDRKVVDIAGRLYVEAPKNRKHRRTIYPRLISCRAPSPPQYRDGAGGTRHAKGVARRGQEGRARHPGTMRAGRPIASRGAESVHERRCEGHGRPDAVARQQDGARHGRDARPRPTKIPQASGSGRDPHKKPTGRTPKSTSSAGLMMAASDNLHPAQFSGKADKSDRDRDKADEYDAKGADESDEFGYSDYDMADYQWNRAGHSTATNIKPEVF